jgi:TRAP-type C4-dicarboxylate transport system permease small subunit
MADAIFQDVEHHYGPLGQVLDKLSRICAISGGVILTLMAFMSLASVVGRSVFDKPILGDYELVQVMSAAAISLFLPFCQMARGHVIVDFFTMRCNKRLNDFFDLLANLLLTIGSFAFAWRAGVGLLDLLKNGDSTMLLGIPTWIGYVPVVLGFSLFGLTSLYSAWEDFTGEHK